MHIFNIRSEYQLQNRNKTGVSFETFCEDVLKVIKAKFTHVWETE